MSGPHKHNCADVLKLLDDYLDQELPPEQVAAVKAHLLGCDECQEEVDVEQELLDCIRDRLRRLKAPPGLAEKIAAALGRR